MARTRLVAHVALVLVAGATALGGSATVAPGDRISGSLGDGDSDTLSFYVGTPSSLDLKAKLDKDLRIGFRVIGPDGSELDAASALKKGLTRKPSLKGLALTRVGTYRIVVEQGAGDGEYDVQFKLGKHKARSIDMTAMPPSGDPAQVAAGAVTFDPTDTTLSATTVQDAVAQLSDAADMQLLAIDDAAADIDELFAASDAAVSQRATMAEQISGLESRVDAVEQSSGVTPSGVETLATMSSASIAAVRQNVGGEDKWVVSSHALMSKSVNVVDIDRFVRASVAVSASRTRDGVESEQGAAGDEVWLWLDVGGHSLPLSRESTLGHGVPANANQRAATGVPDALEDVKLYESYVGTTTAPSGLSGTVTIRLMMAFLRTVDPDDDAYTVKVLHGVLEGE